jgi:catechol 2,3-dioxygenase-like lactoylglutathione lyase family enzyme
MQDAVRLEHVGIGATPETFDATLAFYMDLFGWRVIRELPSPAPGMRLVFIGDGHGGALEVYTAEGPPLAHPAHLAFAVPLAQFAALEARLRAANVAIEGRTQNSAGDELGFFNDPSGNRAQIVGRIEPLGTGAA